jgi:hypothetical protein
MSLRATAKTTSFNGGGEVTASMAIDLSDRLDQNYLRSTVAASKNSGALPWKWFKNIGEVHYAISRSARLAGYANLKCVERNEKGEIVREVETGLEADIVNMIFSPYGGVRGLVDRFYTLMKVPGDSYLIRLRDSSGDLEGYHFLSPDELDVSSFAAWRPSRRDEVRWITLPTTNGGENNRFVRHIANEDMLGRVWTPDRQYVDLPDSALRALEVECEALYLLTKTIKSKLMSRFATAGIFFLPNEVSTARTRRNQERLAGQEVDDTLNFFVTAMTRNMKTWDDAVGRLPILLKGPGDAGDKIRHIVMDQEVFATDLELRRELISRIMQGLDSNQDTTQGTESMSHWSIWGASDEERRMAIQPDLEMMCWALTRLVLHRELLAAGRSSEDVWKYQIWYDLSDTSVRANQQEDARQLRDRGLISNEASRRLSGIKEADAISNDEYVRWVGQQTKNPMLMMYGLPEFDTIDWTAVQGMPGTPGFAPGSTADPSEAGPGEGNPGSPDDRETDVPRTQRPV